MTSVYLDEIVPGMSASTQHTVTERDVQLFGEATGDMNPVHFDEDFARKTVFRGRVAHGALSIVIGGGKNTNIKSAADLAGKKIGMTRATLEEQVVPKVAPPGTNIVFFDEHSATQQALLSGQVDAIGGAAFMINELGKRNPDKGIEPKFTVTTAYYGIAVKPGNFDLLQWVNTWVFVNKQNGVLAKIYKEHTGVDLVDLPPL